jgi:hypothetical protein
VTGPCLFRTDAIVFVVPLAISATSNSIPFGRLIRMRCSSPVAGLRIGRAVDSRTPVDPDARRSVHDVRVELDASEERWMDGARHRPIHPPVCRSFAGVFTVDDGSKRFALLAVGLLVDESPTPPR